MAVNYNKLFNLLEKRNINLTKLSEDLKISSTTISKLKKKEYISLQILEKIANYLSVQIDLLLEFELAHFKTPLLTRLLEEKKNKIKGGIYHQTQILLTYNSNHIEGSKLSFDETRYIFETNTISFDHDKKVIMIDDIIETINHFSAIDFMLEMVFEPLSEQLIKDLHYFLKRNTKDERLDWFGVGEYKKMPNIVGDEETTRPENVEREMNELLKTYENNEPKTFEEIIDFHYKFEKIHPFQDGNGRVGRLIAFKELLRHQQVPFTIDKELKVFYYRGLKKYPTEKGYLIDTCLSGQDKYKKVVSYFKIKH
ncbi:MAG: helix-turn-helix domain-containing protein [Erysipelotrichia bacterium]|nr:helix-turn-helix domain-containing protein [Erysipelotrichia bacterium]